MVAAFEYDKIWIVYGAGPPLPGHNVEVCAGVICTIHYHLNSFPPPPGRVDLPSSTRLFYCAENYTISLTVCIIRFSDVRSGVIV